MRFRVEKGRKDEGCKKVTVKLPLAESRTKELM